jgi:cell division protein FtsI/penicillin-binding protein 2
MVLAYVGLVGRLFYIQVIKAPYYIGKERELTVRRIVLPARRGTVYDRNGEKLAVTIDSCDISAQPALIDDKDDAASRIAEIMKCPKSKILDELSTDKKFVYLARGADISIGEAIKKARIQGVGFDRTTKRMYPNGTMACHVVGFTNVDGKGIEGIERSYDRELRGIDGFVIAEVDAKGRIIPGTKKRRIEPVDGEDLVLTIDATLQHSLEQQLAESCTKYQAAGASAVMIDPKTGEVLALANMPNYDPNRSSKSSAASRRNRAVTDLYEPGSTLKTITACAALEDKAITTTDTWYCHGSTTISGHVVRCSLHPPFMNGHGTVNVAKILKYSCNIGAAGMGFRLGKERLYRAEEAFGLYEKPGSGLPGEVAGWPDNWRTWSQVRLANIAFGQGIAVTPMQMARAYCAVANGGLMLRPYIIKEIHKPDGSIDQAFGPTIVRRVISTETASIVTRDLEGVVTEGTGKNADVPGYRVCGKTGSAQKAGPGGHGYGGGRVVASFAGFLPMSDPRIVLLVAVDEPKGSHFGATVAAPVFQGAAQNAMWRLKVPPDSPTTTPHPAKPKPAGHPKPKHDKQHNA